MQPSTAGTDIVIILADGTEVPVMLVSVQDQKTGDVEPKEFTEALSAASSDAPFSEWLEARVQEDWSHGIGIDYSAAPGTDTFTSPGYVLPAGQCTTITLPAPNNSVSPLTALCEFNGDLFVAQLGSGAANTARVMRSVGGTGALADVLNLGANEYMRGLVVMHSPATGIEWLWATSSDVNGGSGRIHQSLTGAAATWTSTVAALFGTWGRNDIVAVHWTDENNISDWRLVTISSGHGHISYTKPGGNPMLATDWVEGVKTGSVALTNLAAAQHHVFANGQDNLYDLTGQGDSPALTAYTNKHRGNGLACLYHNGYVYRSLGVGLDRIDVQQQGVLQEEPSICSPGWGTASESEWTVGYATALTTYLGGVVCATWCPGLGLPGVFWGIPRGTTSQESRNPLDWHGPFAVGAANDVVTKMLVTSVDTTPSRTRLYLATWATDQLQQPKLDWISLPDAGGALADVRAGSGHRFSDGAGAGRWNRTCRVESMPKTGGDKASTQHIYQHHVGSRGLADPAGTMAVLYTRADAAPAASAWGTGVNILAGPTQTVIPAAVTSGGKIETRVDLISPNGAATPPKPAVLDLLRTTYWRTVPSFRVVTLTVEYGDQVPNMYGARDDTLNAETITSMLVAATESGRIGLRLPDDSTWQVKLRQVFDTDTKFGTGPHGKTVQARIVLALLGVA